MFLLIVVIVLALLVGCRQQCLPPRLCCPRVGVAFLFSSVKCSPPSFLSGRSHTLLCSPPSLSSSGCVLSLSCVGCSRLASCRRGVGPSWALPMPVRFRPAVAPLSPRVLAVRRQTPTPPFCLRQNLPFGRRPLGLPFRLNKPCWLVGWGLTLVRCRLCTARLRGRRTIIYISYPHLYGSSGGMFPPIPLPNTI